MFRLKKSGAAEHSPHEPVLMGEEWRSSAREGRRWIFVSEMWSG